MNLSNNVTQIVLAIVALFAVGIVVKIVNKNKKNNNVNQKNISIGGNGDVVGRDKITKND
ncbi:hypothetical protein ACXIHB_08490 [Tenacibaculum sp. IMCC1]